jgi:hypothetical protein
LETRVFLTWCFIGLQGPPPIPPKAFSGLDKEMAEAFHSLIKLSLVKEPELRAPIDQVNIPGKRES